MRTILFGKVVFEPPSHTETKKYMDEFIHFLNSRNDCVNPLVKAAIAHAQFESVHPLKMETGELAEPWSVCICINPALSIVLIFT